MTQDQPLNKTSGFAKGQSLLWKALLSSCLVLLLLVAAWVYWGHHHGSEGSHSTVTPQKLPTLKKFTALRKIAVSGNTLIVLSERQTGQRLVVLYQLLDRQKQERYRDFFTQTPQPFWVEMMLNAFKQKTKLAQQVFAVQAIQLLQASEQQRLFRVSYTQDKQSQEILLRTVYFTRSNQFELLALAYGRDDLALKKTIATLLSEFYASL
jgi:hypothetical protein